MLAEDGVCPAQTDTLIRIAFLMNLTQMLAPALGYLVDWTGAPNFIVIMSVSSLWGMVLVAIGIEVGGDADALLYVGFVIMITCTWMGSLSIVQLGFYFQGTYILYHVQGLGIWPPLVSYTSFTSKNVGYLTTQDTRLPGLSLS